MGRVCRIALVMKRHRLERQDSFAIDTRVTNIDIVIGRGKAAAGANARCRVIAAGVAKSRNQPSRLTAWRLLFRLARTEIGSRQ